MEEVPRSDSGTGQSEAEEMLFEAGGSDQGGGAKMAHSRHHYEDSHASKKKNQVQTLSVDFDALLPHIGEMGRYQMVLYLLMCIPATLPAAFLAFNQVS